MAHVLLVEDSKFVKLQNERALTKAGHTVITADDGEEALNRAHEKIPDIILLDMLLPKMSGDEVLRSLKMHPDTAAIPVIVLSALPKQNAIRLKKDGAAAYFEKSDLESDEQFQTLLDAITELTTTLPAAPQ